MIETLAPFALITCGTVTGIMIVIESARVRTLLLTLQYFCVAILVSLSVPFRIGLIKIVSGLIVFIILGMTSRRKDFTERQDRAEGIPTGWIFKILAVLLVSTSAIGMGGSGLLQMPGISAVINASSILLMGLGLLQIGLTERPLGIGIGLISLINGFEILYSALEPSIAVMGLVSSIHVGLCIVVSILEIDINEGMETYV